MRIRSIKPEFFKHDKLAELPPLCRILFIGLWCMADAVGRLEDRPARIKVEVLPYDAADADALLSELSEKGFIVRYKVGDDRYIDIPSFRFHQRITGKEAETPSRFPAVPKVEKKIKRGNTRETTGKQPESLEGKGKETERKGDEAPQPKVVFPKELDTEEFRSAWADYTAFRRESKYKELKEASVRSQLAEMAEHGVTESIKQIRRTITRGWQGIFWEDGKLVSTSRKVPEPIEMDFRPTHGTYTGPKIEDLLHAPEDEQ